MKKLMSLPLLALVALVAILALAPRPAPAQDSDAVVLVKSPATQPDDAVRVYKEQFAQQMADTKQSIADRTASIRALTQELVTAKAKGLLFKPRMVKAAYLGVVITRADPTLRAQLKLPDGVGLAVMGVTDDGPAKGIVQEHDVLYKLDDQLLVNTEQFEVILRTHKAGDKITLTVIRQAQPLTLTATLIEKSVPELSSKDVLPSYQTPINVQIQSTPEN